MKSNKPLVKALRRFRLLHKFTGVGLVLFMLIIGITGVALGWKKHMPILQPTTQEGVSTNLNDWKSLTAIADAAKHALDTAQALPTDIDRLDVQPDKGVVKVLFKKDHWEVQVDGKTGEILSVAQRHSDWIERLHDGSIINDVFKLGYTNITGIALVFLSVSGLWLWYGPKVIRRSK